MALKIQKNFRMKKAHGKSGHLYKFHYARGQHDPNPTAILLYRIVGTHPRTKHKGDLVQMLNLNYVPREIRKAFIIDGKTTMIKNKGNTLLTGNLVKRKYPAIVRSNCIRRYLCKPGPLISNVQRIPVEKMDEEVNLNGAKDFSKKMELRINSFIKKNLTDADIVTRVLNFLFRKEK